MRKLINWCKTNWQIVASCLLLAFIPLYPKLPLVDIRNTWVYIRAEDFVVLLFLCIWGVSFIRNKDSLKTPITLPIVLFWLVGAVATLHSIFFILPTSMDMFPNVSFLSFLRRMEYMSLFFIACTSVRNKRVLPAVILTLWATLLTVSVYGIGQKYLGFPAFLTMNEEFAKGIPIQLSALSRVSSTFGGHYDLAAYLVLIIPIFVSVFFAYKHIVVKAGIAAVSALSVVVLFMTVSRISFFALFFSVGFVLFFQKRKLVLLLSPIALLGVVTLFIFSPSLLNRFGSTVKTVDILIDAKTGNDIGHIAEVKSDYFRDKIVRQQFYLTIGDVATEASPSGAFVVPYENLPPTSTLLTEPTVPTGEDLPSGTGYINLALSPDVKKIRDFLYEPKGQSANVYVINGEYLIKRVAAYDLSFTTRFQGEWPRAIAAFERNVLFGSGYGTVSLAVDNSYLRMLGEVGALGFLAFVSIFFMMGLTIVRVWPKIDSSVTKSFVLGFAAGVLGLCINAAFIDVFEASKVAFVLWILTGFVIGMLHQYDRSSFNVYRELKKALTSTVAICVYVLIGAWLLFSPMARNFFVGDDFTWFRWAASTPAGDLSKYFTESMGFFYRPGTKLYFFGMYQLFWLNQTVYHTVSLILHYTMSVLVYFIAGKVFGKKLHATLSAFLFLGLSGFSESIFWVSATGFLFSSNFILLSFLSYMAWRERGRRVYGTAAFLFFIGALLFHELGVVTPFVYMVYEYTLSQKRRISWWIFLPLVLYGFARYFSQSHWLSGDYNYNIVKFPLNALGNLFGYGMLSLVGPLAMPVYELFRNALRSHVIASFMSAIAGASIGYYIIRSYWRTISTQQQSILKFALGFFLVSLLPFLGLGNITSRYSYLASVGIVFMLVYALENLYRLLLRSGRDIALSASGVVLGVFVLWHVVMLQTEHHDWYQAGEKVRQLAISMGDAYENEWGTKPMELHFVNVPIRFGQAWVFPVGLPDALWFMFRNPEMRVYIHPSLKAAFDVVTYNSNTQKVFLFNSDELITQMEKPAPLIP